MNAVEIEQAISELALQPFDAAEFPFTFLAAFGNKDTTLKRLRTGNHNASDVPGGVLLRNNIHLAVCAAGIFHRLFGAAQIDSTLADRFGRPVQRREWFLVPLPVIDEAVQRILDGSITHVVYDPQQARLIGG